MAIAFLADHAGLVDTLADWHHAEWGHLYADWTRDVARAELADHARRRDLPTTLVLVEQGELLGSVSLVLEDAPELSDRGGPWLASLFVVPQARGRGHGAGLVKAAVAMAAGAGVPRLLLFTPGQAAFYRRLGWRTFDRATLRGTPVELMAIAPTAAAA